MLRLWSYEALLRSSTLGSGVSNKFAFNLAHVFSNLPSSPSLYSIQVMFDETSKYTAVFDPLDGSSNVDAGIPTGTIFGIFEHDEEVSREDAFKALQIRADAFT